MLLLFQIDNFCSGLGQLLFGIAGQSVTFEDDFDVLSPNHDFANDEGEIRVNRGDRIPGIPQDQFKLVRIKNKLDDPANNIMINYLFMGKVQC